MEQALDDGYLFLLPRDREWIFFSGSGQRAPSAPGFSCCSPCCKAGRIGQGVPRCHVVVVVYFTREIAPPGPGFPGCAGRCPGRKRLPNRRWGR